MIVQSSLVTRPAPAEYAPFYADYVAQVPEGNILDILGAQLDESRTFLQAVPAERETFRYGPGKWSVREICGHLCDAERIMTYRALRFARGDKTPLPGFEENEYVPYSSYDLLPLRDISEELQCVRRSTIQLFRHLDSEAWLRIGSANGAEVSVRALAWIIAGHERHHLKVLASRYLA